MLLEPRLVKLTTRTEIEVRRLLPHLRQRYIGAWCFVDHFGPTTQTSGMVVAAHPHTGLQTATWVFEGTVEHRDSVGSVQIVEPGQLNLMTAGHGIAHSELSLKHEGQLHAVQLWIALPDAERERVPDFAHHANLPVVQLGEVEVKVFVGELLGVRSNARTYSSLLGAELRLPAGSNVSLPIEPGYEHGVLVVEGALEVQGSAVELNQMEYLETGATELHLSAEVDTVAVLLGGVPLGEKLLMWWNFIGRSHAEIVEMRRSWNAREPRFGEFADHIGGWIPAPELPNVELRPR
jgi:redox-sensitive bicupin YhaK (pirin superfamily)